MTLHQIPVYCTTIKSVLNDKVIEKGNLNKFVKKNDTRLENVVFRKHVTKDSKRQDDFLRTSVEFYLECVEKLERDKAMTGRGLVLTGS